LVHRRRREVARSAEAAGEQDDASPVAKQGQEPIRDAHRAEEVHVEGPPRDLCVEPVHHDAGVVHEHVEACVPRLDFAGDRVDARLAGDVELAVLDGEPFGGEGAGRLLPRSRVAAPQHGGDPFPGELPSDLEPDAPVAARDERDELCFAHGASLPRLGARVV
jgi:hypothetical protein